MVGLRRFVKAHASSVVTQDNYYWYDGLQQVTRHDRGDLTPSSGPPYTGIDPTTRQQQEDFTFDQTGNWTQFQTQSPSLVQSRTHDKANQIASLTNPSSVIQPAFDATGNMTTMPKAGNWTTSNTLQWDAWNRLVKLTEGSSTITYAYDALTRRTTKTNSSETRHYYYDRQWRAVEERVAGASITVDRQYTWSPIDRWTLIRRKRTTGGTSLNETRFVLKDYLDPAAIIDSSATVDERFGYDAFGKLNLMTPAFAARTSSVCDWNFLFHAEFQDGDSGLYNYGYRYYHPELGRWLSKDPIGERGGLNLYRFIENNVVNRLDLLGLDPKIPDISDNVYPPMKRLYPYQDYLDSLFSDRINDWKNYVKLSIMSVLNCKEGKPKFVNIPDLESDIPSGGYVDQWTGHTLSRVVVKVTPINVNITWMSLGSGFNKVNIYSWEATITAWNTFGPNSFLERVLVPFGRPLDTAIGTWKVSGSGSCSWCEKLPIL